MLARLNLSRPRAIALGVVLLVVVGAAVVWAVWPDDPNADLCRAITAEAKARHDADPVTTGGEVAVILGDSYSVGTLLTDPRGQAWSTLLGAQEGWTTYVDAIGGTGFVNGGSCGGQAFGSRVDDVLDHDPGIVVVQGGLNDFQADPADVQDAAGDLLDELSDVPVVVVVGPPTTPSRGRLTGIDGALAAAAGDAHRQYISTADWQLPFAQDGLHPTPEGHQQFAGMVAAVIAVPAQP